MLQQSDGTIQGSRAQFDTEIENFVNFCRTQNEDRPMFTNPHFKSGIRNHDGRKNEDALTKTGTQNLKKLLLKTEPRLDKKGTGTANRQTFYKNRLGDRRKPQASALQIKMIFLFLLPSIMMDHIFSVPYQALMYRERTGKSIFK